ncbi:sensor histidine kinase [Fluviispira vulneris]|uniref:sensor histidine kinase n=1 Tax=Fluviispira vulneris TaxID=2763012 RepID=UPI001646013A|nr:HAMP domain-containing sensor histidine kinase [Fluviispira vulneris]
MKKRKISYSFEKKTLSPLLWIWVISFLTLVLLSISIIFREVNEEIKIEYARLEAILPLITKSLIGEILLENKGEFNLIKNYLRAAYNLDDIILSSGIDSCKNKSIYFFKSVQLCTSVELPYLKEKKFLSLYRQFNNPINKILVNILLFSFLPLFLLCAISYYVLRASLYRNIIMPIKKLEVQIIDRVEEYLKSSNDIKFNRPKIDTSFELEKFIELLCTTAERLKETQKILIKQAQNETLTKISTQVAHDICSPLTVLKIILKRITTIPENDLLLVQNSIERIDNIASNLLNKFKENLYLEKLPNSKEILPIHIDQIISEKKQQYFNYNICFNLSLEKETYLLFTEVNITQFQSILSNLINNAVEAIEREGIINISLSFELGKLILTIIDNGCGMDELILKKAQLGGFTTKSNGHGIGLASSIDILRNWGADFGMTSKPKKGTKVVIKFATCPPPFWYPGKMKIEKETIICIFNDDLIYNSNFRKSINFQLKTSQPKKIIFIRDIIEFIDFYNFYYSRNNIIFFIDYAIKKSVKTGIEIIEEYNISHNSILITNSYSQPEILNKCQKLNIKIIPKDSVFYIANKILISSCL